MNVLYLFSDCSYLAWNPWMKIVLSYFQWFSQKRIGRIDDKRASFVIDSYEWMQCKYRVRLIQTREKAGRPCGVSSFLLE